MRSILGMVIIFCLVVPAFAAEEKAEQGKATEAKTETVVNERISKAEEIASADAAQKKPKKGKKAEKKSEAKAAPASRPDGLVIEDLKVGKGKEAKIGSTIEVRYKGSLKDGKVFDESGHEAVEFPLEVGGLIKGWTEGIPGMKEGGKRKLVIPYAMAYGDAGRPPKIPSKADLVFEVELVKVN